MAGQVNARIGIQLDAAGAISQLRALQTQMSALQRSAALGTAGMAGRQKDMLNTTMQMVNGTRMFTASMVAQESAVNRFSSSLERNKLSMGQYFRYGMSQMPGMRRMFQREWDMMEATARERVRRLNTQYMSAGQGRAIAMRPTDKAMNWSSAATGAAVAAQKAQLFNKVMNDGATSLLNFGKNTQWAGRQLMVGFSIPMGIFAGVASKTFMDLERSMIQFKRVYGDLMTPTSETNAMAEQARQLGLEFTKYGIAVKDTIGVAADVAATGASGEKMLEATRQTLRLATLGQIDYNQAVVATIALQSAFGVSSKDLATSIDFMNAVENQTILSLDDITKAIPRVGPVIKGLGGDYRDLAVMMTALREGGVTAEQGANALKSGLSSLVAPTGTAIKTLKELGINITKIVKDNEDDLLGMLTAAGKAFDKLGKLDKQKGLSALFGKYQYARWGALFENISRGGSQAQRAMELAGMSAKDLASLSEKELGKMSESATFKFTAAVERIKQAIAPIGEMFLNIFTPLIDFGSKLLEKFNELPDGVKKAAVIVVAAIAGIAPVALMTFGLIANGIANIMKTALMFRRGLRRVMGKGDEGYRTMAELDAQAMSTLERGYAGATSAANLHKEAVMALVNVYETLTASASEAAAATRAAFTAPTMPTGTAPRPGSVPQGAQARALATGWQFAHLTNPVNNVYDARGIWETSGLNFQDRISGSALREQVGLAQQAGWRSMWAVPLMEQEALLTGQKLEDVMRQRLGSAQAAFDAHTGQIATLFNQEQVTIDQYHAKTIAMEQEYLASLDAATAAKLKQAREMPLYQTRTSSTGRSTSRGSVPNAGPFPIRAFGEGYNTKALTGGVALGEAAARTANELALDTAALGEHAAAVSKDTSATLASADAEIKDATATSLPPPRGQNVIGWDKNGRPLYGPPTGPAYSGIPAPSGQSGKTPQSNKIPWRQRLGGKGFGIGGAMMGASMAMMFSGNETAMDWGNKVMMASMVPMMLQPIGALAAALGGPLTAAVIAAAAAVGGFAFALKANSDNLDAAAEQGARIGESLSLAGKSFDAAANYFGKETALQRWAAKNEREIAKKQGITSEQQQKAKGFWESDAGKQIWKEVISAQKLGGIGGADLAATKLAQMVMSGIISPKLAEAIAREAGTDGFGVAVAAKLTQIIGPDGKDLKKSPLEVGLEINRRSRELMRRSMKKMFGDILGPDSGAFNPIDMWFGDVDKAEQSMQRLNTLTALGVGSLKTTQENLAAINLQYMKLIDSAQTEEERQKYIAEMWKARRKFKDVEIAQETQLMNLYKRAGGFMTPRESVAMGGSAQTGVETNWGGVARTGLSAVANFINPATRFATIFGGARSVINAKEQENAAKMLETWTNLINAQITTQFGDVGQVLVDTFDTLSGTWTDEKKARIKLDVVQGQIDPQIAAMIGLFGEQENLGGMPVATAVWNMGAKSRFGERMLAAYEMSQAAPKNFAALDRLTTAGRDKQAGAILESWDVLQGKPKKVNLLVEMAVEGATAAQITDTVHMWERLEKLPPELQKKVTVKLEGLDERQQAAYLSQIEEKLNSFVDKDGQITTAGLKAIGGQKEFDKIKKEWKTWSTAQKKNFLLEVGLKTGNIDVNKLLANAQKKLNANPLEIKFKKPDSSGIKTAIKTGMDPSRGTLGGDAAAREARTYGGAKAVVRKETVKVDSIEAQTATANKAETRRLRAEQARADEATVTGETTAAGGITSTTGTITGTATATLISGPGHITAIDNAPQILGLVRVLVEAAKNTGGVIGLANGRWVPGSTGGPNRDSVPALLTPGEFVVTRDVAQKNRGFLEMLNAGKIRTYNRGGYATGGEATDSTDTSADSGGSDSNPWADMLKSMKSDKALAEAVAKAIAAGLPWDMIAEVLSMGEDGAKMLKKLIKANGQINEDNMAKMREMLSGKATLAFQQWQAETAMALDAVVGRSRMINNKKMRGFGVRGALTLDTVNAMPDEVVSEMQRLMQIIKTGKGDVKEAKARLKELWAQAKAVGKALGEIGLREFVNDMRASFRASAGRRALTAGGLNNRIVDELSDENVNYLMELKKKNKEEYKRWMRILKGMDKRAKAEELAAERAEKLANAYEWGKGKREEIWNRRNALNNRRYAQQVGNALGLKNQLSDAGLAAMSDEDLQQYVALLREAKKTGPAGARARAELERINVALNALAHIAAAEAIANAAKLKADVQYALTARGKGLTGQAIAYAQEQGMTLADIAAMSAEEIKKMNDAARDAADALQELEWAAMTKGELGGELGSKYEELAQAYQGKADDQARLWFAANSGYGSIENAQYIIAQKQAEIAAWQRQIADIEYERIRPLEKQIKLIQQENDKLQDQIDIHNRNKELAQRAIDDITKAYDEQFEALDLIEKKEQAIAALRQSQIDLAGALSRGDIFAAASARGQMQSTFSDYARQSMRDSLERQKEEALKPFQDVVDRAEEEIERLSDIMYVNSEKMERIQEQIDAIRDNEIQTLQDAIDAKQREIDQVQAVIDQYELMRQANAAMIGEAMNNAAEARIATGYWDEVIAKLQELIRKLIDMINSLDDEGSGPTTNPDDQPPPQPQTTQGGNPVGQTPSSRVYWRNDDGTISSTTIYENRPTDRPTFPYIAWVGDTPLDTSKVPSGGYYNGYGFATGGWVKGVGNKDSVSAMLTPGEFVVNKNAAKKNARALEDMNAGKSGESSGFTNYRQSPWGQTPNPDAQEGWRNEYYWDTWNPVTGQMEPGIATVVGNSAIVWNYATGEWVRVDAPEASEKPKRYWGVQDHINDGEWTGQDSMFWTMANQLKKLAQSNPSMSAMVDKKLQESGLAWYASISPEDYAKMNEMINSPQYVQTMMTPPQRDNTQYLYNPNTNTNVQIVIPGGANAEQVANIVMQRIGSVVDQGVRRYNR